jgi:hypothetical protein
MKREEKSVLWEFLGCPRVVVIDKSREFCGRSFREAADLIKPPPARRLRKVGRRGKQSDKKSGT